MTLPAVRLLVLGSALLGALGTTGALAVGASANRVAPVAGSAPLSAASCGPGPVRVSDIGSGPDGVPHYVSDAPPSSHEIYFTRAIYTDNSRSGGFNYRGGRGDYLGDRGPSWSTDYANADRHIVLVVKRLSNIDACEWEHPVSLADPELRRFPFVYSLEWGDAALTEAEVMGLRGYLEAGGFMMIDDFWGSYEWANFEQQMRRVLPGRRILEIPRDHLLFHIHYTVDGEILQVPNAGNAHAIARGEPGAITSERDGYVPHVLGIFDDVGRLMVVINWNTDLGDALEWAEDPFYPLKFSTFASELFLNMMMYSMTK